MNLATILILLVLAAAVAAAIRVYRRQEKSDCYRGGCGSCDTCCKKKR